ncbi:MAG: protein kinase [Mariniblastus sp.]
MNTNHIQPDELKRLLYGETTEQQAAEISTHVETCTECRSSLDALAAEPELWSKASKFITQRYFSDTVAVHRSNRLAGPKQKTQTDKEDWDYPVEQLFDPPSHPEMLGNIGSYGVECEVGRGGMGVVLKAFDSDLNRPVAIKILAPHLAASGAARKRFAREARAAAAVLHPNVIAIHGVDSTEKTPYIVMPYVPGPSLQRLVDEEGPLDLKEMVRIAMQISSGLTAAHCQGVIHRDIKPANILIEQGVSRVVITDFGLARAENDASMTQTGWLAGTPNFMSPEQAFGRQLDGRSDLFSLGSLMYFMATGRMPFRADSPMAVLNRICNDQPTPVRQVNSDVSETFADVVEKLLAKDPDDRFQSAGELHQVLEQYLAYLYQPDISKPPQVKEKSKTIISAKSLYWIAGTVALAGIAFAGWTGGNEGWFRSPEPIVTANPMDDQASPDGVKIKPVPDFETGDPFSPRNILSADEQKTLLLESQMNDQLEEIENELELLDVLMRDLSINTSLESSTESTTESTFELGVQIETESDEK